MAETKRTQQLKSLAKQFPASNQKMANQLDSARAIQMQQQVAAAPTTAPTRQIGQAIGGQQAAQASEVALQQQKIGQQQATQVGQLGLAEKGRQLRQEEASANLAEQARQRDIVENIANMSEQAKNDMFNNRLEFRKDELGRTFLNERQLADYAILTAKNEQEWLKYQQTAMNAHKKALEMSKMAYAKIEQALKQESMKKDQEANQALKKELLQAKQQLEQDIARRESEAKNKQAMWSTGGQMVGAVAGGVVGGIYGGPAGAAAGASAGGSLGSGLGSMAYSATNQ